MQQVSLNRVINKEIKYYGLKFIGLIFGALALLLCCAVFNITVGIISALIGYWAGSYLSSLIHRGKLQRLIYWYLPCRSLFGGKYLPPSHIRTFM